VRVRVAQLLVFCVVFYGFWLPFGIFELFIIELFYNN